VRRGAAAAGAGETGAPVRWWDRAGRDVAGAGTGKDGAGAGEAGVPGVQLGWCRPGRARRGRGRGTGETDQDGHLLLRSTLERKGED
jgi:hypothetical protein